MTQKIIKPTDDELAQRWIRQEEDAGRLWVHAGDWRTYRGGIWEGSPNGRVKSGVDSIIRAAKADGVKPTKNLVGSVASLAEFELWRDPLEFDSDPDLLVCNNGTLHLPTRKLGQHSHKHYMTHKVYYDYDPKAKAEVFLYALRCAVKDDPDTALFLQEFAGYCLTVDTSHEIAVWFAGPPGSGKSTLVEGYQAMMGDMATSLGLAQVEDNRFGLGNLPGKRLLISTEQPASFVKTTHILNAIISGEEVRVENKFRDASWIRPVAKILWAMNSLPRVHSAGDGLFRRVKIVKFPAIPKDEQDPAIKESIKDEGAGILNWALDGLDRLRERGKFAVSKGVELETESFRLSADVPAAFIDDSCEVGPDYEIKASLLYQKYKDWTIRNGHGTQSLTSIAEDWERLGFEKVRKNDGIYYKGVQVKMPSV